MDADIATQSLGLASNTDFSLISLLSRSINDPYIGSITTNEKIKNLFGSVGSYFAGTTHAFIGTNSYLVPIFFLIFGFKKTFGIQTTFILARLVSFISGIILLSIIFNYWSLNGGVFGKFLFEILPFSK